MVLLLSKMALFRGAKGDYKGDYGTFFTQRS